MQACHRAHRDENHGDSTYWVACREGRIRVYSRHGSAADSEARRRVQKYGSEAEAWKKTRKGLELALAEHQDNPELAQQLTERLSAAERQVAFCEGLIAAAKEVPSPVETVKLVEG